VAAWTTPEAEEVAKRLTPVPPKVDGSLQAWEFLRSPKAVFVPSQGRQRFLCLIDLEEVDCHTFYVTDELAFINRTFRVIRDVVFLVKGARHCRRHQGSHPQTAMRRYWTRCVVALRR
jgi:hypothetical protein